jgi:uncharacterized membrane protein
MLFFSLLLVAFVIVWLLPVRRQERTLRDTARVAFGLAFTVAGATHFLTPTPFVQQLPAWVPAREALIYFTGLVEIAGGLALIVAPHSWRRPLALLIALYLLAVFPANIYVAVAGVAIDGQPDGVWSWVRLPFQFVYIAWLLWSTPASPALRQPDRAHAVRPYQIAAS